LLGTAAPVSLDIYVPHIVVRVAEWAAIIVRIVDREDGDREENKE
jgi:hypothetical protein